MPSTPGTNQVTRTLILCSAAFLKRNIKIRQRLGLSQVLLARRGVLTALPPHAPHWPARLSSSNGRHDDEGGPPEEHGSPGQDSEFTSARWKQKAWLSCARFSPSSFDDAHSPTTLNRYHAFNKTASRAVSSFLPKRPSNLEVRMRRNVSRTGHDRCPHTRKGLTTTSQGRQRVQLSGRAQHPLGLAPAA